MTLDELEELAKVPAGSISNYKSSSAKKVQAPTAPQLAKLCAALEADANDLLGVEGTYVAVPLYSQKTKAGQPQVVDAAEGTSKELHFLKSWLKGKRSKAKLGVLAVEGRSMTHRRINDGDVVLFDFNDFTPAVGAIFIVRIGEGLTVKELQSKEGGGFVAWGKDSEGVSDQSYGTIDEKGEAGGHVKIVGRVFWRGGKV